MSTLRAVRIVSLALICAFLALVFIPAGSSTAAVTACISLARAKDFHATLPAEIIQVEWRGDHVRRFLASIGVDDDTASQFDIAFFFLFPDGSAQYTVGRTKADLVCASSVFSLDAASAQRAIQAVYGQVS